MGKFLMEYSFPVVVIKPAGNIAIVLMGNNAKKRKVRRRGKGTALPLRSISSYSRNAGVSARQALNDVCELTGSTTRDLKLEIRGKVGNKPRALAVWWLVYGSGQSVTRTAELLKMTPGAAGRILSKWRGKGEGYKDDQLLEWKQLLESKG